MIRAGRYPALVLRTVFPFWYIFLAAGPGQVLCQTKAHGRPAKGVALTVALVLSVYFARLWPACTFMSREPHEEVLAPETPRGGRASPNHLLPWHEAP